MSVGFFATQERLSLRDYEFDDLKSKKRKICKYPVVYAAADILDKITHKEVVKFYNHSGVFNVHGRR